MKNAALRSQIEAPEHLRKILTYDPDTGVITWISSQKHGRVAGTLNSDGYLKIAIQKIDFKAHRVAWIMHHGSVPLPGQVIDHINGNSTDNRARNLRLCWPQENQQNSRRPKNNTSGFKGVAKCLDKFRAYICHNRKQLHLGVFETPQEAHSAYLKAAQKLRWPIHRAN
jgi:hypothetical protein